MTRTLVLSLAGGVVLFFWGFVSHALLPWYEPAWHSFTDEAAMVSAIETNASSRGLYYIPFAETGRDPDRLEAFINVVPAGTGVTTGLQIAGGLIIGIISTFLVLLLVRRLEPARYFDAVVVFCLAGLIIGFVVNASYWNWFQFPAMYTVVTIVDALVGWTLVGLVLSTFIRQEQAENRERR